MHYVYILSMIPTPVLEVENMIKHLPDVLHSIGCKEHNN